MDTLFAPTPYSRCLPIQSIYLVAGLSLRLFDLFMLKNLYFLKRMCQLSHFFVTTYRSPIDQNRVINSSNFVISGCHFPPTFSNRVSSDLENLEMSGNFDATRKSQGIFQKQEK